jgi:PAS domain S-box-containing protein
MTDLFQRSHPNASRWFQMLPFLVVVAVLLVEFSTPTLRVTPSLLTMCLAAFSLLLTPRQVIGWGLVLSVPVVASLLLISNAGVPEQPAVVVLRSAAFVVVAVMAFGLSRYRLRAQTQVNSLVSLFDGLRPPLVISDVDGNINFANRSCCELLGCTLQQAKDSTFFSLFSHPDHRGRSIEQYLGCFGGEPPAEIEMTLSLRGSARKVKSICSVIEIDGRKLLVSQLVASPE